MRIHRSLETAPLCNKPLSAVIGNFDGLHLGHRAIFEEAHRIPGTRTVITFDPHPRTILQPGYPPRMLTTEIERLSFFASLGIEEVFILPFEPLRHLGAIEFLDLLSRSLPLAGITVGFNFNFGHYQEGNPDILLWWSKGVAIEARVVPPVIHGAMRVSSSAIREFILNGEVDRAASVLVYPYVISGPVRRGRHIGTALGFPTVNQTPPDKLLPPDGVYATILIADKHRWRAVTNIGTNPTIDAEAWERTIETHVPDETLPDLSGTTATLYFIRRIRREIRFSSREKLRERIATDIAVMKTIPLPCPLEILPDISQTSDFVFL